MHEGCLTARELSAKGHGEPKWQEVAPWAAGPKCAIVAGRIARLPCLGICRRIVRWFPERLGSELQSVEWLQEEEGEREVSKGGQAPNRAFSIPVAGRTLSLPAFFPSVSSLKADLIPLDYISVLTELEYPLFLVSAFDIHDAKPPDRSSIEALLTTACAQGTVVLLDSGRYESTWIRSQTWSAGLLASVLSVTRCPLAFCYDDYPNPQSVHDRAGAIEQAVSRDQATFPRGTVLPVIHGFPEDMPELALEVAAKTRPLMIAVPERELGEGFRERALAVRAVRAALDRTGMYIPLHLLGTGSPISILVFALAGADSFDGLEWCNTSIDHTNARQLHFHQAELLSGASHPVSLAGASYVEATLANNLIFYRKWLQVIREALVGGTAQQLASKYLSNEFRAALRSN